MHSRAVRLPGLTAGIALAAAAVTAGCASGSASPAGSGQTGAASSPLAAVKLAAQTSGNVNTFTGTMSLRVAAKAGAASSGSSQDVTMSASFAEEVHPTLASVDVKSLQAAGQTLPGGLSEIITPTAFYLKWSILSSRLGSGKTWVAIPVSSLSKSSGVDFSQFFGQVENEGPLTANRLLAAATSVRQVGTGSVGGVPMTEYTGTLSLSKGLSYLSGSTRTQLQKEITAAGLSTATFTVWIDGQHLIREYEVKEAGPAINETISMTLTSINKPVNIVAPPAGETATLPSGDLGGLAG